MRIATVATSDLGHAVEGARQTLHLSSTHVYGMVSRESRNLEDPLISAIDKRAHTMNVQVDLVMAGARFKLDQVSELMNHLLDISSTSRHQFAIKYGHTTVYNKSASVRLSFVRDVAEELGLDVHFELRY